MSNSDDRDAIRAVIDRIAPDLTAMQRLGIVLMSRTPEQARRLIAALRENFQQAQREESAKKPGCETRTDSPH